MAALCVEFEEGCSRGKAEHRCAVCVSTSRVRPDVKVETKALSDGCGLGMEPYGVEEFGSSVSDQGWVDDVELAPDCSC